MFIPQYQVLLKLSQIYKVSLNMVFLIPQNQCYPGNFGNLNENSTWLMCCVDKSVKLFDKMTNKKKNYENYQPVA